MGGVAQERVGFSREADCVAWAWTALDPALVDAITDPAACLPLIRPETTMFYWELHFQEQRLARVDFLHRPPLDAVELAGEAGPSDPIVERLASWYATNAAARAHCNPSVWLELDGPIIAERGERAQGVSVCVDPQFDRRGGPELPGPSPDALTELFTGLEQACDTATSRARVVAEIQSAIGAAGGKLRHVSIMRGRAGQPVKIYTAIPKPSFPAFLEAIEWPGDRAAAARLAGQVCAESKRVNIDLLIDEALSPRIGFEIFSDPNPPADPTRAAATELAVSLGLISPPVVDGLRRWVGNVRRPFGSDAWPTTVQRWFDLKFVDLGAGGLELKAYLGFRLCEGIFA